MYQILAAQMKRHAAKISGTRRGPQRISNKCLLGHQWRQRANIRAAVAVAEYLLLASAASFWDLYTVRSRIDRWTGISLLEEDSQKASEKKSKTRSDAESEKIDS
ncbi:ubiquitin-protein ligase 1 [Striga asiatica]|uniref:Ubiquitin-protein ligase 1 n=1 Tax=Striga asiatica TaxID=4170 RepID=A0A5A7P9Y7_STRAF|nr:ubiquitin-protein ligase 1 [Striga asiatica]